MKPVDQTSLHDKETDTGGDCWRACLASILEVPITDVPDFVNEHGGRYVTETRNWLEAFGLWLVEVRYHGNFPGYMIASGPSPRHRDVHHAVVWKGRTMAHDPHPSRDGIWGDPQEYSMIVPLNAAAVLRSRPSPNCETGEG